MSCHARHRPRRFLEHVWDERAILTDELPRRRAGVDFVFARLGAFSRARDNPDVWLLGMPLGDLVVHPAPCWVTGCLDESLAVCMHVECLLAWGTPAGAVWHGGLACDGVPHVHGGR